MNALILFGPDNEHPFAWLLNEERRHVWCIVPDLVAGVWLSYNWHQGVPIVRVEGALDFDIAAHYGKQGWEVVQYNYTPEPVGTPFVLNNCVGHVKSVLGICSWSLVPNQLFKYVTRQESCMKKLFTVPGFGGGSAPVAPAPPPAPEPVAKKADEDVQTARRDEMKRARIAAGQSGTNKTGGSLDTADATTTKTLLG